MTTTASLARLRRSVKASEVMRLHAFMSTLFLATSPSKNEKVVGERET